MKTKERAAILGSRLILCPFHHNIVDGVKLFIGHGCIALEKERRFFAKRFSLQLVEFFQKFLKFGVVSGAYGKRKIIRGYKLQRAYRTI